MNFLCNNNSWIIVLIIIVLFFCNNDCGNGCGTMNTNSCGCSGSCGCC